MIEVRYNLNMVPDKGSPIHINVSQNDDKCRTFIFKLYSSDGSWTAPASATATIEGRKDDGKFFSFACTYSNGEVTVIVQQQMVAVAGKVRCKIKLVSGAETIESAPFYFVVNPKSMPVNADMSKSDVVDAVAKATQKIVDQVAGSIPQDYVKLNEDVSGLKSDLGELKDVTNALLSNNLLNPNKVKTNTEINQTTGEESQNNGYSVTDFMEVTEGLKYVYASTQAFSFLRICYYSSKNTYINGITLNVYEREHIIEIPSGIKLIRLMVRGNITQDCWFGESETTDYLYSVYGYCGNNAVEKSTVKIDYALYNTDNMYDSSDNRNAKGKIINWNRMNIRGCVYTETFEDNASYHVSMPIPVKYGKTYYMYGNNAGKYVRLQCRRWYMLDKDLKILGRVFEADNVTIDNPYVSFIVFNNELAYKNDIVITDNQNQDDVQENNLYQKRLSDDTGYLMSKETAFDWTGKNICGYGDSITQYGFWIPIVAKWFGFSKYYNYGLSGSHVGDWDADSDWWVGSENFKVYGSTASIAEKPANDAVVVNGSFSKQSRIDCIPSDTDVILIMGGTNDMPSGVPIGELKFGIDYDTTTFKGALAETVKRVQTKLPNAQVVLMTCIYNTKNDITPYNKAIKEVADELGLHYIDTHACGINRFNANEKLRDGTHPTYNDGKYTGSFMMASTIISGLQNIRPHYNDSYRYVSMP